MGTEVKAEGALIRLDPQSLIEQALENNSPVDVMERLVDLAIRVRAEVAREQFHRAMAEFQRQAPQILKRRRANFQSSTGATVRYSYAPLGDIAPRLQETMGPLGLSISWRQRVGKESVVVSCRISHELGHFEESGDVEMPIDYESRTAASKAQRVGIALTYACRYALRSVSGIVAEDHDQDGNAGEDAPSCPMPRRASEATSGPTPAPSEYANPWVGVIHSVSTKTGAKDGKAWSLHSIHGRDANGTIQEFKTFSDSDAKFAREAGSAQVEIAWEVDPKGGRRITKIDVTF